MLQQNEGVKLERGRDESQERESSKLKSLDEQSEQIRIGGSGQKKKLTEKLCKTFELWGNKCLLDICEGTFREKTR